MLALAAGHGLKDRRELRERSGATKCCTALHTIIADCTRDPRLAYLAAAALLAPSRSRGPLLAAKRSHAAAAFSQLESLGS